MSDQRRPWVHDTNAALVTDLYELTMLQAYFAEDMRDEAVFDLFMRRLPDCRNYLLAAGLNDVLHYLEHVQFDADAIAYLRSLGTFRDDFLDWLRDFRFTGDIRAVPEGTPVFANEPIVQVIAPIAEAQVIETFLLNQIQFQTMMASKASRIVHAADGRPVVDFGLRRMHGTDAGVKAARAFHIAGVSATSNLFAGRVYGIPVSGTMAHSYIEAHHDEAEAFDVFAELYPDTVLLVDTYDTIAGIRKVIDLVKQPGSAMTVKAIRLDSGDLGELAKQSRQLLDDAGLNDIGIFVSGGLDEYKIRELLADDAPITGFGVGSAMGVSEDAPVLDSAYKLCGYAGEGRMKLSPNKRNLPGRKQLYRAGEGTDAAHDVIARDDEQIDGRPLLVKVMENGRRTEAGCDTLDAARDRARKELFALPRHLLELAPADPPYRVEISPQMARDRDALLDELRQQTQQADATSHRTTRAHE